MNKKISVIMAIYNCAETLPAAIESIINQTYTNWEFILCDDASTDNTYEIAQSYKLKYPEKIILIRNEENSRLAYSLNHCLQHATGDLVARMDGDDISHPERFEKQVTYLEEHPEFDVVGTAMQRFNDKDGMADIVYPTENPNYFTLKKTVPFHHATIMTYKRVYDTLNGYTVSERTMRGQDYDLWFRFYHAGFNGNNMTDALYMVREDMDAIKRRTFQVRWKTYQTTRYGFKLLNYPKSWLVQAFLITLIKSFTPHLLQYAYRKWQKQKNN